MPEALPIEPYDPNDFQTGDLLLCHATNVNGTDPAGELIQEVTGSPFSHVAMVVRGPSGPQAWQSYHDYNGVGLTPLLKFLQDYQQTEQTDVPTICARHLTADVKKLEGKLQEFIKRVNGRPFVGILDFPFEIMKGRFDVPTDDKTFFCSQLVAATYQAMTLLDTKHPPNWYAPQSFSAAHVQLQLQHGASLGDQIWIKIPPPS